MNNCTPDWFQLGHQQDTSEFLLFLLDNLNEELKKFSQNESLNKFTDLIKKSFGVELTTECECLNCKTKTYRKDTCFCLPLILTQSGQQTEKPTKKESIQTLINHFFHPETLSSENDNLYSCTSCNSLQKATKNIYFTRGENGTVPDHLIFTLNRFIYKTSASGVIENVKIMEQLEYPNEICVDTRSNDEVIVEKYELISIIVHSGSSIHHGHYYSYIKNSDDSS